MLVNSINLSINNGLNKRKNLSKCSIQSRSIVSFSAQRFSSGYYSDWFVNLVKNEVNKEFRNPAENAYINLMAHAIKFREESAQLRSSFFARISGITEKDVELRKEDLAMLVKDLKNKEKPSFSTRDEQLDFPSGQYSSQRDYDRRHHLYDEDADREKRQLEYEKENESGGNHYPD